MTNRQYGKQSRNIYAARGMWYWIPIRRWKRWNIARHYKGRIDILLTDVVMPGLRDTELAQQVAELHDGIRVIYMSGMRREFWIRQYLQKQDFWQKPFRFLFTDQQLKLAPRIDYWLSKLEG